MNKIVISTLFAVLLVGCDATTTPPTTNTEQIKKNTLTQGKVQMTLKIGKTTKTDVIENLGPPNITSLDGSGHEVWTYQKHATVSKSDSASSYGTLLIFGGSTAKSGFESTQKTITLIIKFDANGIVKDFKSQASSF